MSAIILDGKRISETIKSKLKEEIDKLDRKPGLAVILVGDDVASKIYVGKKEKTCERLGIHSFRHNLNVDVSKEEFIGLIDMLNEDENVDGILVQLPLPENLDEALGGIKFEKDVDGLVCDKFSVCTPKGIMRLLEEYNIEIKGKNVVIINNSKIVGKPLANMMISMDATVTVCNEFTEDVADFTRKADILVSGVGIADFITLELFPTFGLRIDAIKKSRRPNLSKLDNLATPTLFFLKIFLK